MVPDGLTNSHIAFVREILEALRLRPERKAAGKAGKLTFWDDGMLAELRAIASGDVQPETIDKLREKFEGSEKRVQELTGALLAVRNQLGATQISKQIDAVVNSTHFGKAEIREDIRELLEPGQTSLLREKAEQVCRKIEILNAELQRLHRMAYA